MSRKTSADDPNLEIRPLKKLPNGDLYKGEWDKTTGQPFGRGVRLIPVTKNKQMVVENFGMKRMYVSIEVDFSNPDDLKTIFTEYWDSDFYLNDPQCSVSVCCTSNMLYQKTIKESDGRYFIQEGNYKEEKSFFATENYPNGEKYVGNWINGLKHGKGVKTDKFGVEIEQEWENGNLI